MVDPTIVGLVVFAIIVLAVICGEGPVFFDIKVKAETLALALPPKDGAYLKDRFRVALLGDKAVS